MWMKGHFFTIFNIDRAYFGLGGGLGVALEMHTFIFSSLCEENSIGHCSTENDSLVTGSPALYLKKKKILEHFTSP